MVPPGGVPPPNQSLVTGKGTTSTGSVAVHPYGFTHNSQTYNSSTGVYDYNHAAGSEHYGQVSHIVSSDLSIIFIITGNEVCRYYAVEDWLISMQFTRYMLHKNI
jgi:hypothetical protein